MKDVLDAYAIDRFSHHSYSLNLPLPIELAFICWTVENHSPDSTIIHFLNHCQSSPWYGCPEVHDK